jgi:hypothetical protein
MLEVACEFGTGSCWSDAQMLLSNEVNGIKSVDPDLEYFAYCYGTRYNNRTLWDYLLAEYIVLGPGDVDRADLLLAAMACSLDRDIITEYSI